MSCGARPCLGFSSRSIRPSPRSNSTVSYFPERCLMKRSRTRPASVLVAAGAVDMPMFFLLGRCLADIDDLDVETQRLARHRMVEVDIDHADADFLHGHRPRAGFGRQNDLHAGDQLGVLEMLARNALR